MMNSRRSLFGCVLVLCSILGGTVSAQAGRDLKTIDVCKVIDGGAVAAAVGGTLAEVRPFNPKDGTLARCAYLVDVPKQGTPERKGYTVWVYPPSEFVGLRKYTEEKTTELPGIGDGAYWFQDAGDGRFKVRALKGGDVTIETTADSMDAARKIAGVALRALAK